MKRRICWFIGLYLLLMVSSNIYADDKIEMTVYEFLEECGVIVNETTEYEYCMVGNFENTVSVLNDQSCSNALRVWTEDEAGETTECIIVGLEETANTYEPVLFDKPNSMARDTSRNYVSSDLSGAPIVLTVYTYYTKYGTEIVNPSGFGIRYYCTESAEAVRIDWITGKYTVTGAVMKDGVQAHECPKGYENYYDEVINRVDYILERTFTSVQQGVMYTATKSFPSQFGIGFSNPMYNPEMLVTGIIVVGSGTVKNINISFSGYESY